MEIGISTACLYPMETEKALAVLLENGFRTFEIFINTQSELSGKFLKMYSSSLHRYGARLYSLHLYTAAYEPIMFFSDYPRRVQDSVGQYRRYFAGAAQLGAEVVVFHGDRRDSRLPMDEYCSRLGTLAGAARSEGVTLAQENVSRCRSATCENVSAIRKALSGTIRFVLDVKQAVRAGESPFAMLDAMGSDIVNVHISDHIPQHDCLLPGAGTMEFSTLSKRLAGYGYAGPLIIEVYRSNFNSLSEISAAKTYLQSILGMKKDTLPT